MTQDVRDKQTGDAREPARPKADNQLEKFVADLSRPAADRMRNEPSNGRERLSEFFSFYDLKQGNPVHSLMGAHGEVAGIRKLKDGSSELALFDNTDDAKNRKFSARLVLSYQQNESNSTETRKVYDRSGNLRVSVDTTLDRTTGALTFAVDKGTLSQTATFENGRFTNLEIRSNGKKISFSFDEKGNVTGVKPEIAGQNQAELIRDANETLRKLVEENKLSIKPGLYADASQPIDASKTTKASEIKAVAAVKLSPEQEQQLETLTRRLSAAAYDRRDSASTELAALVKDKETGGAALAHLARLKGADFEGQTRLNKVLAIGVNHHLANAPEQTLDAVANKLRSGGSLSAADRRLIDSSIRAFDEQLSNPEKRDQRLQQLERLQGIVTGEQKEELDRQIRQLKIPSYASAEFRLYGAEILARTDKPAARQLLSEAMDKDPSITTKPNFAAALVRAGIDQDPRLMQKFARLSGNPDLLKMFADDDLVVPNASTMEKVQRAYQGMPAFNPTIPKNEESRKVDELAQNFLGADSNTPQGKAARKKALEALEKEKTPQAQETLDRLALVDMINRAGQQLARQPRVLPSPQFSASDRLQRYSELSEIPPVERNSTPIMHEINSIMVDHFLGAQSQKQRDQAMEILRKEVQDGNHSALSLLRHMTTVDSALKIADAQRALNDPTSPPEAQAQAHKQMRDALRDLALQAAADKGSLANDFLDMLRKHPGSGLTKDEVDQIRKEGKERVEQLDTRAGEAAKRAISGTPAEREQAAAELKSLNRDQLIVQGQGTYTEALTRININGAATTVMDNLARPAEAADALVTFGRLSKNNFTARTALEALDPSSQPNHDQLVNGVIPDADLRRLEPDQQKNKTAEVEEQRQQLSIQLAELKQAIKAEDKTTIQELMRQPNVVAAVANLMEPHADENRLFAKVKPAELMQILNDPEKLKLAEADARKYAQESFERADGLIGKYLLRDQSSREELSISPAQRRQQALADFKQLSAERLGRIGADFEPMLKDLQSVEQARTTHDSAKKALAVLESERSTKAEKEEALTNLRNEFKQFQRMGSDGEHPMSLKHFSSFLDTLTPGHPDQAMAAYKKLQSDLASNDPQDNLRAIKAIVEKLPNGQDEANEFRALRTVRTLGPASTAEDFQRASAQLSEENKASQAETGKPNKYAQDWKTWSDVQRDVAALGQAGRAGNFEDAKKAMDSLAEQARDGKKDGEQKTPYVVSALAAALAGTTNKSQMTDWLAQFPSIDQRPIYLPKLDELPKDQKLALMHKAADALAESANPKAMASRDSAAISMALASATELGDKALQEKFVKLLNEAVQGPNRDQVMAGLHYALTSGLKGSEALADIYLKGAASPLFTEKLGDIESLARQGDKAGLRILAGVVAGMADGKEQGTTRDSALSVRARSLLEDIGTLPEHHKNVVDSLLHISELGFSDGRFKDRGQLYSTLGTVAGQGGGDRPDVRAALRRGFEETASEPNSTAHKSALDGMAKMAKFWSPEDAETFTKKLTPDVVRSLSAIVETMPAPVRQTMIAEFARIADGNTSVSLEDRTAAVKAMAAAGKYLTVEQVRMLASFGGDDRYNTNAKPTGAAGNADTTVTTAGADKLKRLNILGKEQEQFRADVADALMSVMARGQNAKLKETGPREAAYAAFRDVPWPINRVDSAGRSLIETSNNSEKLRDNLVKYFQGRPYDVGLAGQIGRIVDHAHLPLPPAELLHNAGLPIPRSLDKKPGDPPNLFEVADKIVERYSKDGKDGVEVMRQALKNVDQVNSLSGSQRAAILGWDKLSQTEKENLGWFDKPKGDTLTKLGLQSLSAAERTRILGDGTKTPTAAELQLLQKLGERAWSKMGEGQRNEMRWAEAPKADAALTMRLMSNGRLAETPFSKLVGDLSTELIKVKQDELRRVESLDREVRDLKDSRKKNATELARMTTKDGPCLAERAFWTFTLPNDGKDPFFEKRQNELARKFAVIETQVNQLEAQRAQADYRYHQYATAIDAGNHKDLRNRGEQVAADTLALRMWEQHKAHLAVAAPKVWESLTVSADNTLQGASSLKRLKDRGLVQWDTIPGYESGRSDDGKTFDKNKNREGFEQALGLRPYLSAADANDKRGLVQLSSDERLKDVPGLRGHMLARVNEDPVLHKFSGVAREMNEHLSELSTMFKAGGEGIKYDGFVEVAKQKSAIVKDAMERVSQEDVRELRERIGLMEKAVGEMKARGGNATAIDELEKQIKTYKGMHDLFNRDPKSEQNMLPENRGLALDKDGKPIYDENGALKYKNPREDIMGMCKQVLDGGFTSSTFSNWVMQNGVLIGATLAATALTVAACATLGVSSPLAVGAWVAVAGLVAKEATNEILYHVNKNGYTGFGQYKQHGAEIGDWGRKDMNKADADEKLFKVLKGYGFEVTRDYLAFLATAGLSNFVGGMVAREGFRSSAASGLALWRAPVNYTHMAYQSERLAAQSTLPQCRSFVKEFMENFRREMRVNLGFGTAHQTAEAQIHDIVTPERMASMGENGQFLMGWGFSTSLALGQGLMHGRMGANNTFKFEMKPGHTFNQLQTHFERGGYTVSQIEPGRFAVHQIGAPSTVPPVIMEDVAARGHSLPAEHLFGHTDVPPAANGTSLPRPLEPVALGNGRTFEPTPAAKAAHDHATTMSRAFMAGDFVGSYNDAINPQKRPPNTTVKERPVEFDLASLQNKSPAELTARMREIMGDMGDTGKVSVGEKGEITVQVAKPVVEVNGVKVDLATGKALHEDPITGEKYTSKPAEAAAAEKAVAEFCATEAGQKFKNRVLGEQAVIAQEELIHAHQIANGGKPFSASYAEFVRCLENPTKEHVESFSPEGGAKRTKATLEQEVILALHDSDPKHWTVERLREHFGGQYPAVREPVFKFLEERARLNSTDFKIKLSDTPEPHAFSIERHREQLTQALENPGTTGHFRGLHTGQLQKLQEWVNKETAAQHNSPAEHAAHLRNVERVLEALNQPENFKGKLETGDIELMRQLNPKLQPADVAAYRRFLESPIGRELIASGEGKIHESVLKPCAERFAELEKLTSHKDFDKLKLDAKYLAAESTSVEILKALQSALDKPAFTQLLSDPRLGSAARAMAHDETFIKMMLSNEKMPLVIESLKAKEVGGTLADFAAQVKSFNEGGKQGGSYEARVSILEQALLGAPVYLPSAKAMGNPDLLNQLLKQRAELIQAKDDLAKNKLPSSFEGLNADQLNRAQKTLDAELRNAYYPEQYQQRVGEMLGQLRQMSKKDLPIATKTAACDNLERGVATVSEPPPKKNPWNDHEQKKLINAHPDGAKYGPELIALGVPIEFLRAKPAEAFGANGPVELLRLRDQLSQKMTEGSLPDHISKKQCQQMIDGINELVKGGGPPAALPGKDASRAAWLAGSEKACTLVRELMKPGVEPKRAELAVDILAAQGKSPNQLPLDKLLNPEFPIKNLQFVRDRFMELQNLSTSGLRESDSRAWNAGEHITDAIGKSTDPALKDWVYIPVQPGAPLDFAGMDGMLVNMRTGNVRPIDFKMQELMRTHRDLEPLAPFNVYMGRKGELVTPHTAEALVKDFLSRPGAAAEIPADVWQKMKDLGGFPLAARSGQSLEVAAAQAKQCLDTLQEMAKRPEHRTTDGQLVPWLRRLMQATEGYSHMTTGRQMTRDNLSQALEKPLTISRNSDGEMTFALPEKSPLELNPATKFVIIDSLPGNYRVSELVVNRNGEVHAVAKESIRGRTVELQLGSWIEIQKSMRDQIGREGDPHRQANMRRQFEQLEKAMRNYLPVEHLPPKQ